MPGKWHDKMESYFPEKMREVKFFTTSLFTNEEDKISRRADLRLCHNRTCEIQHSYISRSEIENRFNDWKEFGKEIIWLVDGNSGICCEKLSNDNFSNEI